MEQEIDIRKTQQELKLKLRNGAKGIFDGEPIFKMPFDNLFTIGERGQEKILLPHNPEDFKVFMEHITLDGKPVELLYKNKIVVENRVIQYGVCSVCNGTKRKKVSEENRQYAPVYEGYDKETDTLPCSNCGGQYQWGKPKGEVRLRPDGTSCEHQYFGENVGRCLTEYTCQHCGDTYRIDSGD